MTATSSSVTDPSGSDVSGITADKFVQIRITLTTTDITLTPTLFVDESFMWRLFYNEFGVAAETSILGLYTSGWKNFGVEGHPKFIRRIKVFYTGTSGTLTFKYQNEDGDVSRSFDIDLSITAGAVDDDEYTGLGENKIFTHHPAMNTEDDPAPSSEWWRFTLTENGLGDWKIQRISVEYFVDEAFD